MYFEEILNSLYENENIIPIVPPIIPEETKTEKKKESENKNKFLGRKTKNSGKIGKHNKNSNDNLFKKIKYLILNYIFIFLNEKIKEINEKNKSKSNYNYLKKIPYDQTANDLVEFNQEFLKTNLEIIFSVEISTIYKKYDKNNNIILIQKLLSDKNEEIKEYFEKLFKLTFLDCLEHFRGSRITPLLNGMTNFTEYKKESREDKEYLENLEYITKNYETLQKKRIARKKKK